MQKNKGAKKKNRKNKRLNIFKNIKRKCKFSIEIFNIVLKYI